VCDALWELWEAADEVAEKRRLCFRRLHGDAGGILLTDGAQDVLPRVDESGGRTAVLEVASVVCEAQGVRIRT
jgi:hypothetical protein